MQDCTLLFSQLCPPWPWSNFSRTQPKAPPHLQQEPTALPPRRAHPAHRPARGAAAWWGLTSCATPHLLGRPLLPSHLPRASSSTLTFLQGNSRHRCWSRLNYTESLLLSPTLSLLVPLSPSQTITLAVLKDCRHVYWGICSVLEVDHYRFESGLGNL